MAFTNCVNFLNTETSDIETADIETSDIDMDKDFHGIVLNCLSDVFFYHPKKFRYNSSQCNNLCHACVAKLSTYYSYHWRLSDLTKYVRFKKREGTSISKLGYQGRKIMQRAWKEMYRVVKEAEVYLQHCSAHNGWIRSIILSNTGEAYAIHIHDLAWTLLCLDLNLLYSQAKRNDSYTEASSRKISDFRAEMSNCTRIHDEYEDKRQLVFILEQFLKAEGSNMNDEERNRVGVARFMWEKLQATIRSEPAFTGNRVSSWLQIDIKDLVPKQRPIGQGSFGEVYEGSWLGLKVAVKEIPMFADDNDDFILQEAVVHAKLQSPFIVQLIGLCFTERCCYIVMELVSSSLDGILQKRVERDRTPLPLPVAVDMMLQISRGMEYLHSQRIMHMDLKAANVLLEPSAVPEFRAQGYGRVKLCDFGEASLRLYSFRCSGDTRGTPNWRAPEVFPSTKQGVDTDTETLKEFTYKADVYSFAMTCYEILTGKQPFQGVHPTKLYGMIMQGKRPSLPRSCPSVLSEYIRQCWEADPGCCPTFADVSNFMRYMKLLVMRMNDSCNGNSSSAVCKDFDKGELVKCSEGGGFDESLLNLEEEGLIIKALDGHFPNFFQSHPLSQQSYEPVSHAMKDFVSLPDYIQPYTDKELQNATNNFSRKIPGVSFSMWKGILSDGTHVAVEKQQLINLGNEIKIMCHLHHPNAVRLRGVSAGFVAYDHMVMGSLGAQLFSQRRVLNWNTRRKIGMGIARFLAHLHDDHGKRFLNFRVNCTNILLDERFTPKFYSFRSAISVDMDSNTYSCSDQRKVELALRFEEFRNVQDFGVILFELVTGCKWENCKYSLHSIHKLIEEEESEIISKFLDRELQGEVDEEEARRWVKVALWCLSRSPSGKPSMNKAILAMKGLLDFHELPEKGALRAVRRGERRYVLPAELTSNMEMSEMVAAWGVVRNSFSDKSLIIPSVKK